MKNLKFFFFALIAAGTMTACGGNEAAKTSEAENVAAAGQGAVAYGIDVNASELQWHGSKLAYGHTGVIKITDGSLSVDKGNITAGNFTVDMKTIQEVGAADPKKAQDLAGHLMSPDFFDADKHPTSSFAITGSTAQASDSTTHLIKGNLTIKGISKNIEFPAKVTMNGDNIEANASFTINRNDWGVTYGTGLSGAVGDKIISDNIDYKVSLKGKKQGDDTVAGH